MVDHAKLEAFGIDFVDLSDRDNEKLGDLLEDNDRLNVENRQLRSQLGQLQHLEQQHSNGNRSGISEAVRLEMSKMEDELARLLAENADLKTGVKPSPPQGPPRSLSAGASVRNRSALASIGSSSAGRLQSQNSSVSVTSSYAEMEAEYEQLMVEHKAALNQVTALEDQVDALQDAVDKARSDTAQQQAKQAQEAAEAASAEAEGKLSKLQAENAELRQHLDAAQARTKQLQSQVSTKQMMGRVASDAEVAQSDALVMEILQLQRAVSGSVGSAAAAASATANAVLDGDAADKERAVALATLDGLTKQNRQLRQQLDESSSSVRAAEQETSELRSKLALLESEAEAMRSQLGSKAKTESGRVINKLLAKVETLDEDLKRSAEKNSALSYSVRLLQGQLNNTEAITIDRDRLAAQVDSMKQEMQKLATPRDGDLDSEAFREVQLEAQEARQQIVELQEEVQLAKQQASDAHLQASRLRVEQLEAQQSLNKVAKQLPELEAANGELERLHAETKAHNEQLQQDKEQAAQAARRLTQQVDELVADISRLQDQLDAAEHKSARLQAENNGLNDSASGQLASNSASFMANKDGGDDVALLQELQHENDKLETENQRISITARELLADKAELLDRLTNVAMEFAGAASETATPRHEFQQSPMGRFQSFTETPEAGSMSLPSSPAPATDSHRRSFSSSHPNTAAHARPDASATGKVQRPMRRSATQALQALFSQIDSENDPDEAPLSQATTPQAPKSPRPPGNLDTAALLQKHAAQADALAAAGSTPEDTARRAALKKRSDLLLRSFDRSKADRTPRHSDITSSPSKRGFTGPVAELASQDSDSRGSEGLAPHDRSATAPAPDLADDSGAAATAAAAAAFGRNARPFGLARANPDMGASRRLLSEPLSPTGSASSSHSASRSQFSTRTVSARSDAPGEGISVASTPAHAMGLDRPPRPLGTSHSRNASASETANSHVDAQNANRRASRRDIQPEVSHGVDAATSHVAQEADGSREDGTSGEQRRSRHELERAARLRHWAEAKVDAAYSKWAGRTDGVPEVAAFMRTLGWAFRGETSVDPGQEGALFDTALAITHPSRGRSGSSKDKAVAAAAHAKLLDWRRLALQ